MLISVTIRFYLNWNLLYFFALRFIMRVVSTSDVHDFKEDIVRLLNSVTTRFNLNSNLSYFFVLRFIMREVSKTDEHDFKGALYDC